MSWELTSAASRGTAKAVSRPPSKWLVASAPSNTHLLRRYFERRKRMPMTRQDVVSVLGPVDNATIAEIIASGASLEELREAWAWAFGDEALMSQGRPLPGTRVAA